MSEKVCKVINKSYPAPNKTFIVLGVSRSGTSMVAGILREIGIFMGDVVANNHEDPLFLGDDVDQLKKLILERNNLHNTWGWKAPKSIFHISSLLPFIRNPHFIILSRDPYDIANSMKKREELPFDLAVQHIFSVYKSLQNFVDVCTDPLAIVSYNRAIANKDDFVSELMTFLDCPGLADDSAEKARNFIGDSYRSTSTEAKQLGDLSTASANPKAASIINQIKGSSRRTLKRVQDALNEIEAVSAQLANTAQGSIAPPVKTALSKVENLKARLDKHDGELNDPSTSPSIVDAESFRSSTTVLLTDVVRVHRTLVRALYLAKA